MTTEIRLATLADTEFEALLDRLEVGNGRMVDPVTGNVWPLISGSQDDVGGDGDGDYGDDDGDDDVDPEAQAQANREAKMRRNAMRAGRKGLLKDLGFANAGQLKAALAQAGLAGDDGDDDGAGSGKGDTKPEPKPEPVVQAVDDVAAMAQLTAEVALELASAGIDPKKVKRATQVVLGDLDAGDAPSSDDVADVIDTLREEEPGWFPAGSSSGDGDEGGGSSKGVPAPSRRPSKRAKDPEARSREIFESRFTNRAEFKLPTPS